MTPRLARFQCPTCGALLRSDPTEGAVPCDYCGRRSATADPLASSPRSFIAPAVDRSSAALAFRRTLVESGVLPASLRGGIEPVDLRPAWVPFHVARAIRVGVVEKPPAETIDFEMDAAVESVGGARSVSIRATRRERPEPDRAKVVLVDVECTVPAVRRPGWGIDSLSPGAMLARGASEHPHDPENVRRHGAVLAADLGPEEALRRLAGEAGLSGTTLVAPSLRTVLVPVWRLRYRVQGCLYDATLDAVEGRLPAARAPEDDRRRIPVAVAYVGVAALLFGLVGRGTWWLLATAGGAHVWLAIACAMLVLLGLFGSYAWDVVRYDAERVLSGGSVLSEYVNRPRSTGVQRLLESLLEGLARAGRRRMKE
ncbi:MAG: hypothetical protein QME96_00665 [Myxococcota bacterium]|nr:hypothetical protein [Myxococcota bacterium]